MRVLHGAIKVSPDCVDAVRKIITAIGGGDETKWTLEGVGYHDKAVQNSHMRAGLLKDGTLRMIMPDQNGRARVYHLRHKTRSGVEILGAIQGHLKGELHRRQTARAEEAEVKRYDIEVVRGKHSTNTIPQDLTSFVERILDEAEVPRGRSFKVWAATPWREFKEVGWKLISKEANGVKVRLKSPGADEGWECIIQPKGVHNRVDELYLRLRKLKEKEVKSKKAGDKARRKTPSGRLENLKGAARKGSVRRPVLGMFPRSGDEVSADKAMAVVRDALGVHHMDGRAVGRFLAEVAKLGYLKQHRLGGKVSAYSITKRGLGDIRVEEPKDLPAEHAEERRAEPKKMGEAGAPFESAIDELQHRIEAVSEQIREVDEEIAPLEQRRKDLQAEREALEELADKLMELS